MTTDATVRLDRFRRLVAARLGLQLEGPLAALGEAALAQRAAEHGLSADAWLARMEAAMPDAEVAALGHALTVNETYFFRNMAQFDALRRFAQARRRGAGAGVPLRVLSAGCSSGEEAYSIAMTLSEAAPAGMAWSVRAVDVDSSMIEKARSAVYTPWALREVAEAARRRWFRIEGARVTVDDAIRRAVQFEQRNLAVEDAGLWPAQGYDVVFCRNVMMYLARPAATALVARIAHALVPGGVLFLGNAENLRGLSSDFEALQEQDAFFWRRLGGVAAQAPPAGARAAEPAARPSPPSRPGPARGPGVPRQAPAPLDEAPLARLFELAAQERFDEALRGVRALPEAVARQPDARLLLAVLLAHDGEFDAAVQACTSLLAQAADDAPGHADAQHVLALCREGAGDPAGAAACDRRAVTLDPSFAMPCLHLALLARRNGDAAEKRRRFAQAAALLEREQERRLLLFGGGFGREALLGLCRAELQADGQANGQAA